MHCLKNVKTFVALCIGAWLFVNAASADAAGVTVKKAELRLVNGIYRLSADIDYQISSRALDALQNGIPLFWDIKVVIEEQRNFLWNKTLIEKTFRYRVQYHALLFRCKIQNHNIPSS